MVWARMRPRASASGQASAMLGGLPAVARRDCATSNSSMVVGAEITGSMGAVQLVADDAFPRGLAGAGRARHAEDQRIVGGSRESVGLKRGAADVEEGKMAEEFAEAGDDLVEQGHDG